MLRIDINLLFTIVNLLVLYFLMKKFLFKPVREVLAKRQGEIDETYKKAEEANKAAADLKKQYEDSLAGIEAERQKRLDASNIEASKEYDEIVNNANKKADKIIQDAKLQAEKDAEAKQHEMQQQMAVLVAQAAYKIAASKDSSENDEKLYDTFLSENAADMTENTKEQAKGLIERQVQKSVIEETTKIFDVLPETSSKLSDPTIPLEKRHEVIDSVFPVEVRDVLKLLCDNNRMGDWKQVAEDYFSIRDKAEHEVQVRLHYVTKPSERQILDIQKFVKDKYEIDHFSFTMDEDKSLGGGFILEVGNDQYDWSTKGRREQFLRQINATKSSLSSDADILTILQRSVNSFDLKAERKEIGFVETIGDGIAIMNGLDHAMYGEVIQFDNGVQGMVQNIERDRIGVILFGDAGDLAEGSRGTRTGRMAGVPVGNAFLGRRVSSTVSRSMNRCRRVFLPSTRCSRSAVDSES